MSSRDNINELWSSVPFDSIFSKAKPDSQISGGVTDVSEDSSTLQGIDGQSYKKEQVSLQQKVGYLYAIQGAGLQKGFAVRPQKHQIIDGVIDPISPADAERQRKSYEAMVNEERKSRKEKAEKAAKEEADKKTKEDEERRKKEEELRKSEEDKKQKAEKAAKEEARLKAQVEKDRIQKLADEEGMKNDRDFLIADAKAHLNPEGTFPKRSSDSRVVIVTPIHSDVASKKDDIIKNRKEYCSKHNYVCLFPELNQVIDKKYNRWKATCLLQKLVFKGVDVKDGDWIWYLDPTVVITNLDTPVGDVLLQPDSLKARLSYGSRFITGRNHFHPTMRFPLTVETADNFQMIVSREPRAFNTDSFFVKNTERMRFWLDMWSDHVVAEGSSRGDNDFIQGDSLQHIYLNHPTLREVTAVVTPRLLISQPNASQNDTEFLGYHSGDITAKFVCKDKSGCPEDWKKLLGEATLTSTDAATTSTTTFTTTSASKSPEDKNSDNEKKETDQAKTEQKETKAEKKLMSEEEKKKAEEEKKKVEKDREQKQEEADAKLVEKLKQEASKATKAGT
ncbi:hypothetical protein D0Z00_000071 [Geotrichum galactomycetum]|uniref:Uncharacterized protein n=1 Tax=Geotrichum galactomycetum TaxID=27317 RepID=A0ACB6VAV2_9ASCO|nr:hypothetical protein D0Z00_000071 [Geotrichum candidum]